MKNSQIIGKIFAVQSLLEKVSNELIFKKYKITAKLYGPMKMISVGIDRISEMKKYLSESPASITQKLSKLEKAGYIKRILDKNDKRIWIFSITKKGQKAITEIDQMTDKQSCIFGKFSKKDLEIFWNILNHLETGMLTDIKHHYENKK